jgi:hypothetical protein
VAVPRRASSASENSRMGIVSCECRLRGAPLFFGMAPRSVSTSDVARTGEQPDNVTFSNRRAAAPYLGLAIEVFTTGGCQEFDALPLLLLALLLRLLCHSLLPLLISPLCCSGYWSPNGRDSRRPQSQDGETP